MQLHDDIMNPRLLALWKMDRDPTHPFKIDNSYVGQLLAMHVARLQREHVLAADVPLWSDLQRQLLQAGGPHIISVLNGEGNVVL